MASNKDKSQDTTKYIVYALEKVQKRDSAGKFLKKEKRYISKHCPKVILSRNIFDAKIYNRYNKALYALNGACARQKFKYDFYVTKVKIKYEIDEKR